MKFYLYVLRSIKDKKLYIGVSASPEKRLIEHNHGKNKSTKFRRPFNLIYTEVYNSKNLAYKREWEVKNTGQGNIDLKQKLAELAKVVTAGA